MEGIVSTTGKDGDQEVDQRVLGAIKPLHRFIQRQPKSLGIVIVIFGCAELLMSFPLGIEIAMTSCAIYIPFWQGFLFLVCGNLSIYTEVHPSKKMVTVCLAMYVVSILGIIVSLVYRFYCFANFTYQKYRHSWNKQDSFSYMLDQALGIECILFISSLCVLGILIFLCAVARFALKSTRTQIIVQSIPAPQTGTTTPN